ncbi:hypothetical protein TNCV_3771601 [Trichonephila clavipes]|nr:hypothetical protein TNCV_3771601 [Trichonephila clavipes]
MQVIGRIGSLQPQFLGRTPWGVLGPPTSLPHPPPSREDLLLDGYKEYANAVEALHIYIYEHPCFLRDSNPGQTLQQLALLTTIPYG